MAKAKQAQEESVILTPKQARAVTALQFEREQIVQQANEQIGQIMDAFQEQGSMLALVHQLPRDEGVTYRFDGVDVDGQQRVKLTAVPAPVPDDSEAPAAIEIEQAGEEQGHGD